MNQGSAPQLCASCDRCRARKTRCDGKRPCSACKQKYMKKHKISNVDGIDEACFECVYSPAKRRGPVPGHKQFKENGAMLGMISGGSTAPKAAKKKQLKKLSRSGTGGGNMPITLNALGSGGGGQADSGGGGGAGFGGMNMSGTSMNMSARDTNNIKSEMQQQMQGNSNKTSSGNSPLLSGNFLNGGSNFLLPPLDPSAAAMQQHVLSTLGTIGLNMFTSFSNKNNGRASAASSSGSGGQQQQDTMATAQNSAQQQLAYVQQLQLQQQMQAQQQRRDMNAALLGNSSAAAQQGGGGGSTMDTNLSGSASMNGNMPGNDKRLNDQRPIPMQQEATVKTEHATTSSKEVIGCTNPQVMKYISLIHPTNPHGMHLRACYTLSCGGLFGLPPIPTNEEYCRRFDKSLEPHNLPKFDVAALQAARFAELSMGALADSSSTGSNNLKVTTDDNGTSQSSDTRGISLMLALANASVLCLKDCVEEKVHPSLVFDVARAYFFHAIVRAHVDDMDRYFKYRRVCLRYLSQLDGIPGTETLMAAISFQDSLIYMIYNASEHDLPNIDGVIPRISQPQSLEVVKATDAEKKYGISFSPSRVSSNLINQMWMQGAPPVLINESAPPKSRALDALACAVRSMLDEAKSKQAKEPTQSSRGRIISRKRKFLSDAENEDKSATEWAVEHHPNELSCTNLLAESPSLLKEEDDDDLSPGSQCMFGGHHLLVSAMEVLNKMEASTGETDYIQLPSILSILDSIMERPLLLFQGGPTYHIITNCVIYLARIINKLRHNGDDGQKIQIDEALNVYHGSRLALEKHRKKLPWRLQCHEIPAPNFAAKDDEPVIDLAHVSLCLSRACQDCISSNISAKEVAMRVRTCIKKEKQQQTNLERLFDANDRALLANLSWIISQEVLVEV